MTSAPTFSPSTSRSPLARVGRSGRALPGLALAVFIGALAEQLARLAPTVGAPVIAILIGMVVAIIHEPAPLYAPGIKLASKKVLQLSVVLFGAGLSLHEVLVIGRSSLPVLLGTLGIALAAAFFLGRLMGVDSDVRTLIGVGTAICGASAIAATDAVIDASEHDVSYAVATIFTFNVAAVLSFPALGHLMHMNAHAFGLWSGTAINDVSSVVAASSIYSHSAETYAIVVKLSRTLAIIPISLVLSILHARRAHHHGPETTALRRAAKSFPWFVAWFVAAVALNSLGVVPAGLHGLLNNGAQYGVAIALAGVGLSTRLRSIRATGARPLVLGAMLWVVVALASLGLQALTGTL